MFRIFEKFNSIFFGIIANVLCSVNVARGRTRILIFTDSRGFEVTKFWNRKNPFSSYIGELIFVYSCKVFVCPEKFTSLLDFIDVYEKLVGQDDGKKQFDFVILHCGIVDFAPRPESSYDEMYREKIHLIEKYGLSRILDKNMRTAGPEYAGEVTYSFLNAEALREVVLPRLVKISNLVYIGVNRVLHDWDGSYWRKRPQNINDQLGLDKLLITELRNSVCMNDLHDAQVRAYTSDNVHYNKTGFAYIATKLKKLLPAVPNVR